ncbi:MAG TPA: serine hydrolase domain-containing protein, partial [Gemmatimonadaceae bacterium]|nr:serine hydrolase domain-containing protein [Gemmatimonadaceae bacterium]
ALLAVSVVGSSAGAQRPSSAALQRTVDSLAAAAIADGPMAAMSVAVVRGRDTVVSKGYGLADVENDVPATPGTVYRIGSITKQFTAAAVMQLVEEGKLSLDDSIGATLTTLPAAWRSVSLRQLLNHTSGIPSYTNAGPRWLSKMRLDLPHDSLLAIVAGDTMDFRPGTSWRYNNTGYYLLGMLIERVSGQPYDAYLQARQFAPLGLKGTMYCHTAPIIKHRAHGYQVGAGRKLVNADPLSMGQPFAAGSLCSTVGDLVAWQRALADGRVVSAASYRAMTTPEGAAVARGYGYGLASDTLAGHRRVQHGGGINGFNAMLAYYPDDTLSVVVLGNTNGPWVDRVADNIGRAALGAPLVSPPQAPRDVATTPEQRQRYAGTYRLALPGGKPLDVRIFEQDGKLMMQGEGQGAVPLLYQGDDTFRVSFDPGLRLTMAPGTPAPKATLVQGGATMEAPRVR